MGKPKRSKTYAYDTFRLTVTPSLLRGHPGVVDVLVCHACGAMVGDASLHARWHTALADGGA